MLQLDLSVITHRAVRSPHACALEFEIDVERKLAHATLPVVPEGWLGANDRAVLNTTLRIFKAASGLGHRSRHFGLVPSPQTMARIRLKRQHVASREHTHRPQTHQEAATVQRT